MILEMLLGSSALILAVFALRAVFGRRMGARLRYALWLLVLLRLLLPVHLGRSAVSPANLARVSERDGTVYSVPLATGQPSALGVSIEPDGTLGDANSFGYPVANADGTVTRYGWKHTLPDILPLVWKIGMAVAAAWYLLCNVLFYRGLRRTRTLLRTPGKVPVYVSDTPSPCLFGLFRPAIYVTAEAARDPDTLSHVLLHEETHLRHGDHFWAFLRTVCLAVWWFNPLVYLAAAASRRDCELFCDEAVIRQLGEEGRVEYGRTLLALAGKKRAGTASCAAATLSSGGRPLRQRIRAIAKWAKPQKWAILAAVLLALLSGACAFSGARESATAEPEPPAAPEALEPAPRSETGSDAAAPEFPPAEETVRTAAEGLGWTLDPEGTQSWAENHILYTFETGEQTDVAVSCAMDEGKRFLTETCFAIFLPDKPQFAWEDWKKSVTLAETLYGGFSEGELYQALSGQNIPEPEIPPAGPDTPTGMESLVWEAQLPAGYGRVSWHINAGSVERSFPSPVIRDWRITFFISIYESREAYESLRAA